LKQLFHIKSQASPDPIDPVLSLRIGERHCSFAVTDRSAKEIYSLAYYSGDEVNAESLGSIFMAHPELSRGFHSVQVGFDHPQSLLVPFQLFDKDAAPQIMSTMFGKKEGTEVLSEPVKEWQLYNIYSVNGELRNWLARKFTSANYYHNYSVSIRLPSSNGDRLVINLQTDEFSIVGMKHDKLVIAVTYEYASPSDVLYHLLKICELHSFSQRDTEICIAGLIERESALFREIYQYFLHTSFREPGWDASNLGDNQFPNHFFTPLNDLARCAS